jgi:hypothetical protein
MKTGLNLPNPQAEAAEARYVPSGRQRDRLKERFCGRIWRNRLQGEEFPDFQSYLTEAEKDHQKSQREGRHKNVPHCGNLFLHKLRQRGKRDGASFQSEFAELARTAAEEQRIEVDRQAEQSQRDRERRADYSDAMTAPFNRFLFDQRVRWGGGMLEVWKQRFGEEGCREALGKLPHWPAEDDTEKRATGNQFQALLLKADEEAAIEDAKAPAMPAPTETRTAPPTEIASHDRGVAYQQSSVIATDDDEEEWFRNLVELERELDRSHNCDESLSVGA